MYQRILVPLDGSELAEQALPVAERLRARTGVVHLVRIEPAPSDPATAYDETLQLEAESYLDFTVARLADRGVAAQWETRCGDVVTELLAGARDHACDVIALSSHGRTGMARLVFGSVAERVLKGATLPTLFVRAAPPGSARPAKWETILVPLDGADVSERAVEPAAALAREHGTRLHLLYVVESLWAAGDSRLARDQFKEVGRISQRLKELAVKLCAQGVPSRSLVVRGDPSTELLAHATRYAVDLIVMTPTSGDRPAAFGHVSEKVLRTAPMPVLVVRKQ